MKRNLPTLLFYIVFLFDVVLNLIPTWKSSFVTRFMDIDAYRNMVITLSKSVNTVLFLLILLSTKKKLNKDLSVVIVGFSIWVLLSILINFDTEYLVSYVGLVVIYLGLFTIKDYSLGKKALIIATMLMVVWCISAVLYLPFASGEEYVHLFAAEYEETAISFCGWGTHRNYYGYYAGLSIVLLFTIKSDNFYYKIFRIILTGGLLVGIFMSGCRTVLVAVFISLFFLEWHHTSFKQRIWFVILAAVAIIAIYNFGTEADSRIVSSHNEDRNELFVLFAGIIADNPILGTGEATFAFSGTYPEGSPCHNFLFQTAADWGLPALLMFLFFLFIVYRTSTRESKTILIYLMIFGFFQPYFSLNCPIQFTLIAYLLVVYFNHISSNYQQISNKPAIKKAYA